MADSERVGELLTILLPADVSAGPLVEAEECGMSREALIVKLLSRCCPGVPVDAKTLALLRLKVGEWMEWVSVNQR